MFRNIWENNENEIDCLHYQIRLKFRTSLGHNEEILSPIYEYEYYLN